MSILDKILARYGYINEADDDNNDGNAGGDVGTTNTGNADTGANDNTTNDNTANNDTNANNNDDDAGGDDDDIDINTDLDDNDDTSDDGSENDDNGDDSGNIDTGGDTGGGTTDTGDEEPVPENKELFDTLTAEEQAIKIKELKMLYFSMYQSLGDIAKRLDSLDTDDDEIITISRISGFVYDLRTSMHQYITVEFDQKSYMENDFMYNRFLVLIHAVTNVINEIYKIEKRKHGKEE